MAQTALTAVTINFPLVPAMLVGALEFGGIGALIDYFIKGRTVVYRAGTRARVQLVPIVFAQQRGVRLLFRVLSPTLVPRSSYLRVAFRAEVRRHYLTLRVAFVTYSAGDRRVLHPLDVTSAM